MMNFIINVDHLHLANREIATFKTSLYDLNFNTKYFNKFKIVILVSNQVRKVSSEPRLLIN